MKEFEKIEIENVLLKEHMEKDEIWDFIFQDFPIE